MKKNLIGYFFCVGLLKKMFEDGVFTEEIVEKGIQHFKDYYKVSERDITLIGER